MPLAIIEPEVSSVPSGQASPLGPEPTPEREVFKGLAYFEDTPLDARRFAGRAGDVAEVAARIQTQRVLVLYGRSGLGKTSLLLAGVFPRLREAGFVPVYVRVLENPLDDLAAAVLSALPTNDPMQETGRKYLKDQKTTRGLLDNLAHNGFSEPRKGRRGAMMELLQRAAENHGLAIVLDQFEEFYIRARQRLRGLETRSVARAELVAGRAGERAMQEEFIGVVGALIGGSVGEVRIVFSLREDHLAALDAFQRVVPDLFSAAYRLLPLTSSGARLAIVTELDRVNIHYDPSLVSVIVDELAEFDFESSRLQITLQELLRIADRREMQSGLESVSRGRRSVTMADLAELKSGLQRVSGTPGLARIYRGYVMAAVDRFNTPAEQDFARVVLDRLLTADRTKQAQRLAELVSELAGPDETARPQAERTIKRLVQYGILREDRSEYGTTWIELIHECLVPEIEAWLREDEAYRSYRIGRDFIASVCQDAAGPGMMQLLLAREQLERFVYSCERLLRLTAAQSDFVFCSIVASGDSQRSTTWAQRLGWDTAEGLWLRVAEHRPTRAAAFRAARGLERFRRTVIAECVTELGRGGDRETLYAAGATLGDLGGEAELLALASSRERKFGTRADLFSWLKPDDLRKMEISPWLKWKARTVRENRFRHDHHGEQSLAGRRGIWVAVVALFGWLLVFAATLLVLLIAAKVLVPAFGQSLEKKLGALVSEMMIVPVAYAAIVVPLLGRSLGRSTVILYRAYGPAETVTVVYRSWWMVFVLSAAYALAFAGHNEVSGLWYWCTPVVGGALGMATAYLSSRILRWLWHPGLSWRQAFETGVIVNGLVFANAGALGVAMYYLGLPLQAVLFVLGYLTCVAFIAYAVMAATVVRIERPLKTSSLEKTSPS